MKNLLKMSLFGAIAVRLFNGISLYTRTYKTMKQQLPFRYKLFGLSLGMILGTIIANLILNQP